MARALAAGALLFLVGVALAAVLPVGLSACLGFPLGLGFSGVIVRLNPFGIFGPLGRLLFGLFILLGFLCRGFARSLPLF